MEAMAEQEKTALPETSAAEHREHRGQHRSHRGRYHRYHGDKKKARNRKILMAALIALTAAAVLASAAALLLKEPVKRDIRPDYTAESLPVFDDTLFEHSTEWGPVHYSKRVAVDLSDKSIELLFRNPENSGQKVYLQLCIGDDPVFQTGALLPGEEVTAMELLYNVHRQISAGGYDGKFVVIAYDLESGEINEENAEIPLVLSVAE